MGRGPPRLNGGPPADAPDAPTGSARSPWPEFRVQAVASWCIPVGRPVRGLPPPSSPPLPARLLSGPAAGHPHLVSPIASESGRCLVLRAQPGGARATKDPPRAAAQQLPRQSRVGAVSHSNVGHSPPHSRRVAPPAPLSPCRIRDPWRGGADCNVAPSRSVAAAAGQRRGVLRGGVPSVGATACGVGPPRPARHRPSHVAAPLPPHSRPHPSDASPTVPPYPAHPCWLPPAWVLQPPPDRHLSPRGPPPPPGTPRVTPPPPLCPSPPASPD